MKKTKLHVSRLLRWAGLVLVSTCIANPVWATNQSVSAGVRISATRLVQARVDATPKLKADRDVIEPGEVVHLQVTPPPFPPREPDDFRPAPGVAISVSNAVNGKPVGSAVSLRSQWHLADPGLYRAVAVSLGEPAWSIALELEVVSLKLDAPKRGRDGRYELRAERLGGRPSVKEEPVTFEISGPLPSKTASTILGWAIPVQLQAGSYHLRATSTYKGRGLHAEQRFEVPMVRLSAHLEVADPRDTTDGLYRVSAHIAPEALSPKTTAVRFTVICATGEETRFDAIVDESIERRVAGHGQCSLVARAEYFGNPLISKLAFIVPEPPLGSLELATPLHIAENQFEFLARRLGGAGPQDQEVTFSVSCNAKSETFTGYSGLRVSRAIPGSGLCTVNARTGRDGRVIFAPPRTFVIPIPPPNSTRSPWLLLPLISAFAGAAWALKKLFKPKPPPHVAYRVLRHRAPKVDVLSSSAPRLTFTIVKGKVFVNPRQI